MNAYKLFWILLKAILRGHGRAPIYFDTEAREFHYHMACVGYAYCQDASLSGEFWITLHEVDEGGAQ